MTLQEAYRLLQRYDDWRTGRDLRTIDDAAEAGADAAQQYIESERLTADNA